MTLVIDLDNGTTVFAEKFKIDYERGLIGIGGSWNWYSDPSILCEKGGARWIWCQITDSRHLTLIAVRHIIHITKVDA